MPNIMYYSIIAISTGLAAGVLAQRDVPANLKSLYDQVKGNGCSNFLQDGFYDVEGGSKDFGYCGDRLADSGIVYITGAAGQLANMDIDCDGEQDGPGNDGRCGSSTDTQSQTTWQDEAARLSGGAIADLNAFVHTYVVLGNDGTEPAFDPRQYGIEPLSLVAVVCGDNLVYGVWGDTNGNDGPPLVGEAAISIATLCFGDGVNGNAGHDPADVLFVAFAGKDAVPRDADWGAQSAADFEASLTALGDSLVAKVGGGNASVGGAGEDNGKVGSLGVDGSVEGNSLGDQSVDDFGNDFSDDDY